MTHTPSNQSGSTATGLETPSCPSAAARAHVLDAGTIFTPSLKSPSLTTCRFFETEGVAIVTMLVSRYKITVKEEPQFAHETFEERKERVLQAKAGLTLTCVGS